jgi:hypothetical protein
MFRRNTTGFLPTFSVANVRFVFHKTYQLGTRIFIMEKGQFVQKSFFCGIDHAAFS